MKTDRELLQMALDFIEYCWKDILMSDYAEEKRITVETALREALARPELPSLDIEPPDEFFEKHLGTLAERHPAALVRSLAKRLLARPEQEQVEVWHGDRKVTVYETTVLRSWGPNIESQQECPRTAQQVQDSFSWLYAQQPAEPDMRSICEALGFDPTNHHNALKCPYCRPAEREPVEAPVAAQSQDALDAARYRWLTDDHQDPWVRDELRTLFERLPVMSYSAACQAIDALASQAKQGDSK